MGRLWYLYIEETAFVWWGLEHERGGETMNNEIFQILRERIANIIRKRAEVDAAMRSKDDENDENEEN